MRRLSNILLVLLFVVTACIERIAFENIVDGKPVTIFGYITDDFGPHEITVGYGVSYSTTSFINLAFEPIQNASVVVEDDNGNQVSLTENLIKPGTYVTPETFKGEVGRSYRVKVQLGDEGSYESEWETLNPVPPIDNMQVSLYQQNSIENGIEVVESGVEANITFDDPEGEENYYRWRWNGTYEVQFSLDQRGPCWVTEPDIDIINIMEDGIQDGLTIERSGAKVRLRNRANAQDKYVITVEQLSLSKEAFVYYSLLQEQREQQGTIFDQTPAPVSGNLYSVNDEEARVLGYFHASAISTRRITSETIMQNVGEGVDCDEFVRMGFRPPRLCYNCMLVRFASRNKPDWY